MCLIAFAWRAHPDYPLLLAANRDEAHARASSAMGWWDDETSVLGGRDLEAGGSWLAFSRNGRLATVTNFREKNGGARAARSRGEIVSRFVAGGARPGEFAAGLDGDRYAGYSVLLSDGDELVYASNRGDATTPLAPGVYGLSNASLDTPWPKLVASRESLRQRLGSDELTLDDLFDIVADRRCAPPDPSIELPFEMSRAITAAFIVTPEYGTRCSTALLTRTDGHIEIGERRFDADGETTGESRFVFIANDR